MKDYLFHFCLQTAAKDVPLQLSVNGEKMDLRAHTSETLEMAGLTNGAVALLDETQRRLLTHYVNVPENRLSQRTLSRLTVTESSEDGRRLPILHHMSFYLPTAIRANVRKSKQLCTGRMPDLNSRFGWFGISDMKGLAAVNVEKANQDIDYVLSPLDEACTLVFHHPALMNNKAYTAAVVMDECILPSPDIYPMQYNVMIALANSIKKQGPDKWATRQISKDFQGNPMCYGYQIGSHEPGDEVEFYKFSKETEDAMGSPMMGALKLSTDNRTLQNQCWSIDMGTSAALTDDSAVSSLKNNQAKWVWKTERSRHGVRCEESNIPYNKEVEIPLYNSKIRTLGVYAQFIDSAGKIIESEQYDEIKFEDKNNRYVGLLPPMNVVMGIPIYSTKTNILIDKIPPNAVKIKLVYGTLGTGKSYEYGKTSIIGICMTSVFQIGIPSFFLLSGNAITDGVFLNELMVAGLQATLSTVLGSICPDGLELMEVGAIMSLFADSIGALLVQKGMEMVLLKLTGYVTAEKLMENIPFVGWTLRALQLACGAATLTETIVDVASNPASFTMELAREMDVRIRILPDPEHGVKGGESVWPLTADHYEAFLIYKGMENTIIKGEKIPEHGRAVEKVFCSVPIGGTCQLAFNIYSETDWLCGIYESGQIIAEPGEGGELLITGNIKEMLVPLTKDTRYVHKYALSYQEKLGYQWIEKSAPTANFADLDGGGYGDHLCRLCGINANETYQQTGYVFSASGCGIVESGVRYFAKSVTKLSLETLDAHESEISFASPPMLAFDKLGDGSENYLLDGRSGVKQLRKIELEHPGFGLLQTDLQSYGKVTLENVDKMISYPDGKVIAVDWRNNTVEVVDVSKEPRKDAQAVVGYKGGGEGRRQGLLNGAQAISVARDGRILILESQNRRIQAFDSFIKPVMCFEGTDLGICIMPGFKEKLEEGEVPDAFWMYLWEKGQYKLCTLPATKGWLENLGEGYLDNELCAILSEEYGIYLYPGRNTVAKAKEAESYQVTDDSTNESYYFRAKGNRLSIWRIAADIEVKIMKKDEVWRITDFHNAVSYFVYAMEGADQAKISECLSYFPLKQEKNNMKWLDIAVEEKGYIYVLYCHGDGRQTEDFYVDVYEPTGKWLFTTPDEKGGSHVCANNIEVDKWRTLFTLNFEAIRGPQNRTEPSLGMWTPTTP